MLSPVKTTLLRFWSVSQDHPEFYPQGRMPETFQDKSLQINKFKQILDAYSSKRNYF